MSNNRGSNRRRGRGGNRSQGNNPVNRIDSRARGNAPQLLEKYKKLAHDASLNGDRVQAEYYLQFADHYFRVIADSRAQKDEARAKRDQSYGDDDSYDEDESPRQQRRDYREQDEDDSAEGERVSEGAEFDPDDNPFIRDSRNRGRRKGRRDDQARAEDDDGESKGFDPSVLPPSIAREGDGDGGAVQDQPKPRRRISRKRTTDGDSETLEAVG